MHKTEHARHTDTGARGGAWAPQGLWNKAIIKCLVMCLRKNTRISMYFNMGGGVKTQNEVGEVV